MTLVATCNAGGSVKDSAGKKRFNEGNINGLKKRKISQIWRLWDVQWLYMGARICKATPGQQGGHGLDRRTNGWYHVDLQYTRKDQESMSNSRIPGTWKLSTCLLPHRLALWAYLRYLLVGRSVAFFLHRFLTSCHQPFALTVLLCEIVLSHLSLQCQLYFPDYWDTTWVGLHFVRDTGWLVVTKFTPRVGF